ncbi:MAG: hypothetical protein AAFQ82_04915, partial [Myxococcota bacterium]
VARANTREALQELMRTLSVTKGAMHSGEIAFCGLPSKLARRLNTLPPLTFTPIASMSVRPSNDGHSVHHLE